jgi:phage terminase small subunit
MTPQEIRDLLREENPSAKISDLEIYARQFATYFEASENIQQNGAIVAHPRTGQPMDNPHLKLRTSSESCLQKMRMIRAENLWREAIKKLDLLSEENS